MLFCARCRSLYRGNAERCGLDGSLLTDVPGDPLVGTLLDRFRLLRRLAVGAMGCVYLAEHRYLRSQCAIKIMLGDLASDPEFQARFQREAVSTSRILHPNVIRVFDFGVTPEGVAFLVMEYVDGRTLEDAINQDAPFEPERARRIVAQIAAGLASAHHLGFVHRDVKPANIMLRGLLEEVKILDFGTVAPQRSQDDRLTDAGQIIGTPAYMAPEQARNASVSPAADLYALGCILYEMLSGRPPFTGNGRTEILLKHLTESARPLEQCGGLERIVERLLEKDPALRIRTSAALIELLTKVEDEDQGLPKTQGEKTDRSHVLRDLRVQDTDPDLAGTAMQPKATDPSSNTIPSWALATLLSEGNDTTAVTDVPETLRMPPVPPPSSTVPDLPARGLRTEVVRQRRYPANWMSDLLDAERDLSLFLAKHGDSATAGASPTDDPGMNEVRGANGDSAKGSGLDTTNTLVTTLDQPVFEPRMDTAFLLPRELEPLSSQEPAGGSAVTQPVPPPSSNVHALPGWTEDSMPKGKRSLRTIRTWALFWVALTVLFLAGGTLLFVFLSA